MRPEAWHAWVLLAGILLPARAAVPQLARPPAAPPSLAAGLAAPAAPDSTRLFGGGDWALVAGLVAAQVVFFPLDDEIEGEVQRMRSDATDDVRDVVQPLGRSLLWYSASAATFAVGKVAGERRIADLGLHAFLSLALANTVTGTVKGVTGRWRPRVLRVEGADTVVLIHESDRWSLFAGWREGGHRQSYPSGHASAAFTIATVLSEEFGGATPWVAYPIATAVAWSRLNDDVHWATDVTMGALVGIVSGRLVVRYGHRRGGPLERWLLLDVDPVSEGVRIGLRAPVGPTPSAPAATR